MKEMLIAEVTYGKIHESLAFRKSGSRILHRVEFLDQGTRQWAEIDDEKCARIVKRFERIQKRQKRIHF